MRLCPHCGSEHADDVRRCPRTSMPMIEPGPIGGTIDRYKVEKLLGTGGFGAVYQATHARTNQAVALKVLRKEKAQDTAAVDRFMREARAVAMLGSEHIVKVLDAEVSADGVPFIAMELLDGVDLQQLDKDRGPLHPERLVGIMLQTLDGLAAAHEKGIVHRDMKPGNIFVTRRRNPSGIERDFVKLLDFGISKVHLGGEKALTAAGTTLGTPGYMAYEQFVDSRAVDARADLYSVAAILYELLSRRLPYPANSYGELIMKIENETPPPLKELVPQLPDRLCDVVDKGLKKNRDERFQSAAEFTEALSMVGSMREVQLKTAFASPMAPEVDRDNETKARSPTTEPGEPQRWQVVQTVIAPTVERPERPMRVGDSTVLMPPPDFKDEIKETKESAGGLPGPRPSRPVSQETRDRAMTLSLPKRSRWELWLLGGGAALLAGAAALWLAMR